LVRGRYQPWQLHVTLHGYNLQIAEHPSKSSKFPSSHSYVPARKESPHVVEHRPLTRGNPQPEQLHVLLHP